MPTLFGNGRPSTDTDDPSWSCRPIRLARPLPAAGRDVLSPMRSRATASPTVSKRSRHRGSSTSEIGGPANSTLALRASRARQAVAPRPFVSLERVQQGVAFPRMARSRKTAWLREELVLALDLYVREGLRPARESRQALSETLRAFPDEAELAVASRFRDLGSVDDKLWDFARIDPDGPRAGRSAARAPERAIWDEFGNDRSRLRSEAKAVRERLNSGSRYDVVAFLRARTKPLEDPMSGSRFSVVECAPDATTYRQGSRAALRTVATATLQMILNEVLDRARGDATFIVTVALRFDLDHRDFANAVIGAIAGHVFDLFDGVFGDDDATLGSDRLTGPSSDLGVAAVENIATHRRFADLGSRIRSRR